MTMIVPSLLLVAALISDVRTMKIPNWLSLGGALGGIFWHLLQTGWTGGLRSMGASAGCMAILFVLYAMKAIGAGDVKLFGAFGAWLGFAAAMRGFLYSVWIAGLFAVVLLLMRSFKEKGLLPPLVFTMATWKVSGARRWMHSLHAVSIRPGAKQLRFPFMLAAFPGMVAEMATGGGWL